MYSDTAGPLSVNKCLFLSSDSSCECDGVMAGLNDLCVLLSFSEHKTVSAANGQVITSTSIPCHSAGT